MMPTSRLLELNCRTWLRRLSEHSNRPVTLASVPGREIDAWGGLGLTHLWLMGVWPTGQRSRGFARSNEALAEGFDAALPGWTAADVGGSPYAIGAYEVPRSMGGMEGLARFRRQLASAGIRLILDFVPNHVGLDHAWVHDHPDWFIQTPARAPGACRVQTCRGVMWLAHGRDPYFAPWEDTLQVDVRQKDVREALTATLLDLAGACDGVRCDMAMLLLSDIFDRTWPRIASEERVTGEFWEDAINEVRNLHPAFQFIGEVYWDMEARLQAQGFDFTYDKRLYDYLMSSDPCDASRHLRQLNCEFLARSVHFLENHDEPRVASLLSPASQRAATLVTLALPGLCLLHEGQVEGARLRHPIQLARRQDELVDEGLRSMHEGLIEALNGAGVGEVEGRLLEPRPAWDGNPTWQSFVIVLLQPASDRMELVVVNLAAHQAQCYVPIRSAGVEIRNWRLVDRLGSECHERRGEDLVAPGLYLDVPAHAAQIFSLTPVP